MTDEYITEELMTEEINPDYEEECESEEVSVWQ